jgi:hypothetical protein
MKVLIISAFPPDPAPEANHALHISEHLISGLDVHVLCKKGSIAATQENIVVHPVINDWLWSDLPRLAKCMKSCRLDVVLLLYLRIYNHEPMITFCRRSARESFPAYLASHNSRPSMVVPRRSFLASAPARQWRYGPAGRMSTLSLGLSMTAQYHRS